MYSKSPLLVKKPTIIRFFEYVFMHVTFSASSDIKDTWLKAQSSAYACAVYWLATTVQTSDKHHLLCLRKALNIYTAVCPSDKSGTSLQTFCDRPLFSWERERECKVSLSVCWPAVSSEGAVHGQGWTQNGRSGKEAAVMDEVWEFAGLVITWVFGVGQAQDGAALGWTDASPKRNHRISST